MDKLVQRGNFLLQVQKYTWEEVNEDTEYQAIREEIKKVKEM